VATWSVEYARVNQVDPESSLAGGGWPHTCLDVLAALNTLASLPEAIRMRLDLSRVYLCGHSAGGYLALWLGCFSRLPREAMEVVAFAIEKAAGVDAAAAARAGIAADITIRGVIGLAAVASLAGCATLGLSDFHDAALNFLWRAGPTAEAAIAAGQLGAACPLTMWCSLPEKAPVDTMTATAGAATVHAEGGGSGAILSASAASVDGGAAASAVMAAAPTLRVLLIHGLDDVDVPAAISLSLSTAAWSAPQPPPMWLLLLPGCDHYVVAGLGDTNATNAAPGAPWPLIASALRAFVAEDDASLNAACCTTLSVAERLAAEAIEPVCARRSMGSIAIADPKFMQWAQANHESAMHLARGLRRWLAWVGEAPSEAVRMWLETHERP